MRGSIVIFALFCFAVSTFAQTTKLELQSASDSFSVTFDSNTTTWTFNSAPYYVTGSLNCMEGENPIFNTGAWSCGTFAGFPGGGIVDSLGCTDGQVPRWDAGAQQWTCIAPDDILNEFASNCADGQILKKGSSAFSCGIDDNDFASLGCTPGQVVSASGSTFTCLTLADADTLAMLTCTSGQIAKWNGTAWSCGDDVDTIGSLNCVSGDIPRYNGSAWVCDVDDDELASLNCSVGQTIVWNGTAFACSAPPSPTAGSPVAFVDGQQLSPNTGSGKIPTYFGIYKNVDRSRAPIQIAGGFNTTGISVILSAPVTSFNVTLYKLVNSTNTYLDSLVLTNPTLTASKTLSISLSEDEGLSIAYYYTSSVTFSVTSTVISRHFVQ